MAENMLFRQSFLKSVSRFKSDVTYNKGDLAYTITNETDDAISSR